MENLDLGFPLWVRLTHFFNILFLSLLIRSGIEILGGHPMLYWNDHSTPGSEWVRFTRKRMPAGELWTAEDEKQPYSPLVALPGRDHLGLGRYWHFAALAGWIVTGAVYVLLLFASPQWQRLVPTSLDIFPKAAEAALAYFQLQSPPAGDPYNALQQLAYFGVIFVLSPLQIATGLAMSPAVAGRFPWYPRLFGGRQAARSIHFLGLIAFIVFIVHHTALVIADGLTTGLSKIVLGVTGEPTPAEAAVAVAIGILGLAAIVAVHIWATHGSLVDPRRMQNRLQRLVDPPQRLLLQGLVSRQAYPPDAISPVPRPNGRPPHDRDWQILAADGFRGFTFEVSGPGRAAPPSDARRPAHPARRQPDDQARLHPGLEPGGELEGPDAHRAARTSAPAARGPLPAVPHVRRQVGARWRTRLLLRGRRPRHLPDTLSRSWPTR